MIIHPAKRIVGKLEMPGDKSISHRAAMIAALANGTSRISNFSTSEDCAATLRCLNQLGVKLQRDEGDVIIHGGAFGSSRHGLSPLDCGNSGTTMRLLAGVLAGQTLKSALTGDESLRARPMHRIIEPLQMMGATVSSHNGRAPLAIQGRRPLTPIRYDLLLASAQVQSCILFAGLSARGRTEVIEKLITRDHTERIMRWFGVPIETTDRPREGSRVTAVKGPAAVAARGFAIPGDISSAAYFVAAAALVEGSSLVITNVGLNPTRTLWVEQMRLAGFEIVTDDVHDECNEPRGAIRVTGQRAQTPRIGAGSPLNLHSEMIPQLIDELPLLAVVGSQLAGGIEMRDAGELRVKESDRIAATVAGLRAMGADVEEFDDGLRVGGRTRLRGARIDSRGDHRIAMSFAVAGLLAEGETEIEDGKCVSVSFPEFFDLLESVVER